MRPGQGRGNGGRSVSWAEDSATVLEFVQFSGDRGLQGRIDLNGAVEVLAVLIPPLGITTVAEGLVRFAYLFFARERNDKEWFSVLAQTLKEHVIVCGAGRVGYRVFEQLRAMASRGAIVTPSV